MADLSSHNRAAGPGGTATHTLSYQGATLVSFVPNNDAFSVSFEQVGTGPSGNLTLIVVGALNPATAGYGGTTDQLVGLAILASALVMFAYRRLVQDRAPLRLREATPRLPDELSAEQAFVEGVAPAGMARADGVPG